MMTRKMAIPYVSFVVDDALCGRHLDEREWFGPSGPRDADYIIR